MAIVNSLDDMRARWERYAMAWGPVGAEERKQILNETLAEGFHYLDPRIECHGQDEVTRNLEAFQQRQPGGGFVLRDILAHHNVAMVSWQLIKKDGEASNRGHDVARFDQAGFIKDITGFFSK
jgi:hypothetical protein